MSAFTEKAIIDTFIDLLNRKPLDKITVKDLVDECGINRSTFYYYFEDIYDLLNHIFESETERTLKNTIQYDKWHEGFIDAISFALQNKRAIYHIYNSMSKERLDMYLNSVVGGLCENVVRSQSAGISVSESDRQMVADIYRFLLVGMIYDWLKNGMKEDAVAKIDRLNIMLEGNIREMLERAAKNPER